MTRHSAILHGPYLKGTRVLVSVDELGRITGCSAVRSLWSGSHRFDAPFREQYNPIVLYDAGEEYYAWLEEMSRDDDSVTPIAA